MKIIRQLFDFKGTPVLVALFTGLFIAETVSQLRKRKEPRSKRLVTNVLVSVPAFSLLRLLFLPVMVRLARKNKQLQLGLNNQYLAPEWVKVLSTFLLLDYGNYLWHVLNHRLPFLWRFHVVHHTDPDLDLSTAIRFHFGELLGSVFFRGAFVILTGATPRQVLLYEIAFEGATQFHHSNWKLPYRLEKLLNLLVVTPRMHGIHHSVIREETDSNYSVIFSFWDRLHGTSRLNVKQQEIVTGVPGYTDFSALTAGYLLRLPFTSIRSGNQESENDPARIYSPDTGELAP